jgi:hypothetical protein
VSGDRAADRDHDDGDGDGDRHAGARGECKDGGWKAKGFRNQGQCVSSAARDRD